MNLPDQFLEQMKRLLGTEYKLWLDSFSHTPAQGLRVNVSKTDPHTWETTLWKDPITPVPWTTNGYYYPQGLRPAKHPYYYAGLYYLQEPSAMAPAALLPIEPGDCVLDLCAAPGGKSTELGAKLQGSGLLVSNDISNSRARALLKNLELFGISNICVTSEEPEKLAQTFGSYFDKILVDAPCSGEGMFRKDPDLIKSWIERGPLYYSKIQQDILGHGVKMLKPGGMLLYSTCTFGTIEDEEIIKWLLKSYEDMELCDLPLFEGARCGMEGEPVIRLFPHHIQGEGHFMALLRKKVREVGDSLASPVSYFEDNKKTITFLEKETDFFSFTEMLLDPLDCDRIMVKHDMVYYLPKLFDTRWKLRYLRTGLLLGTLKNRRFEPSQAFAMTLKSFWNQISFDVQDDRVIRYLKGETIALRDEETVEKSWCLVGVQGFPLGWAKGSSGTLKNKYYPGWRWQ